MLKRSFSDFSPLAIQFTLFLLGLYKGDHGGILFLSLFTAVVGSSISNLHMLKRLAAVSIESSGGLRQKYDSYDV